MLAQEEKQEQEQQGKEIRRILATWNHADEKREVEVQGVENGQAFVQPTSFDSFKDDPVYYHGWLTPVSTLTDIHFMYVDGTREYMGNPPVNSVQK